MRSRASPRAATASRSRARSRPAPICSAQPLPAFDERSPYGDAFVAELDAAGARQWVATFGGKANDAVAGVAIDAQGRVAVAANARDAVHVGATDSSPRARPMASSPGSRPTANKVRCTYRRPRVRRHERDRGARRARRTSAASSPARSSRRPLAGGGGGDDAYAAAIDHDGNVVASWQLGGEGREEVVGIAAIPGGFVAGVAHTAKAVLDGGPALPAPADPMTGAALIVRGAP